MLFVEGNYILRYSQDGAQHYRCLSAAGVRAAFLCMPTDSGWLSPRLIRMGSNRRGAWVIGAYAAGVQRIAFAGSSSDHSTTCDVALPALVLAGIEHTTPRYHIWAITDKPKAISGDTVLYNAPLPNVYADGRICFGANPIPPVNSQSLDAVWQLFLAAPFTGALGGQRCRSFPTDPRSLLMTLAERRKRIFPRRELVPAIHPATLDGLIAALTSDTERSIS